MHIYEDMYESNNVFFFKILISVKKNNLYMIQTKMKTNDKHGLAVLFVSCNSPVV